MSAPAPAEGLRASGVMVRLDGTTIIDGVDCRVAPGTLTALVGPNGSGKSTLLRSLAGVEPPAAGEVRFDGVDLLAAHRRERARTVAFVEQETSTELALTVRSVVELGRTPHRSLFSGDEDLDRATVDEALAVCGMAAFAERGFGTLSGGERQQVMLAKAIAQRPRLLLLDEPTNHLDIHAQLAVMTLLGRLATSGVTVLAALHDLNLATAFSDAVIVMRKGRVVAAGETASTLSARLIGEVYGVRATVIPRPGGGGPVIAFDPADDPPAEHSLQAEGEP